jgi:exopolyphosphatase/guanosine-5'-triphosphate,3'-diphosphate pyrophosphatase
MLIAECQNKQLYPQRYRQKITRLAGDYQPEVGLARESIERTLDALSDFLSQEKLSELANIRIVGTAALRRAENAQHLVNLIKLKTRLDLEIISGHEEARLSSAGVLSVLEPLPKTALIVDIGGGSTELIFYHQTEILYSCSYPLGVVQLCEEMPVAENRRLHLQDMVVKFSSDLLHAGIEPLLLSSCELIGTAGTVTSLAALDLKLEEYDRAKINNHILQFVWLENTLSKLDLLSVPEREQLPGMEPGRGDVIIPGLELVIALCRYFKQAEIRVADAGLLEGILLDFCRS